MTEPMARGVNFLFAREYVIKNFGESFWKDLVGELRDAEIKSVWESIILSPKGSYPFKAFKALVDALAEKLHVLNKQTNANLYSYMAGRSLNVIYKTFFRFRDPAFVISNYNRLWERFFEFGTLEVVKVEKRHAILSFTVPEIAVDWLRSACLGFSMKAIDLAGGKDLVQQETGRTRLADGNWRLMFELKWAE